MVCERLAEMGEYSAAGELMLTVENIKEALDYFMAGEGWTRARDIAKNVAPRCIVCVGHAMLNPGEKMENFKALKIHHTCISKGLATPTNLSTAGTFEGCSLRDIRGLSVEMSTGKLSFFLILSLDRHLPLTI